MGLEQIKVELQEWMGSDEAIANAAWTSTYNKERREDKYDDPEKVKGIVQRCVKDGHSTPIESVVFRFWFRWPIFCDRQHMTHRIASHNGLSGRYRTLPSDFYELPKDVQDIMFRAEVNQVLYTSTCEASIEDYQQSVQYLKLARDENIITEGEYKRVREIIRGQMPTAGMVERTTIMNLNSFANYQRLRNHSHAQPEIRQAAKLALKAVVEAKIAPVALRTLHEEGWTMAKPNHEVEWPEEGLGW